MKKWVAALVATALVATTLVATALLAGCTVPPSPSLPPSPPPSSVPPASSSIPPSIPPGPVDFSDDSAFTRNYLNSLLTGGMLNQSWESPSQIEPDNFVIYYAAQSYHETGGTVPGEPNPDPAGLYHLLIPEAMLEDFVSQHFEVSPDHLRTAENYYSAEQKSYLFGGMGSTGECVPTGLRQQDAASQ